MEIHLYTSNYEDGIHTVQFSDYQPSYAPTVETVAASGSRGSASRATYGA